MPVMTPSEFVMDVYTVNGFSYEDVDQATSVVGDQDDAEPVGACGWPSGYSETAAMVVSAETLWRRRAMAKERERDEMDT